MPYSNPVVLQGMFNATRDRMSPMNSARTERRKNLEEQFRNQEVQNRTQETQTRSREGVRRIMKDIHEMGNDKRVKARKTIEDETAQMLYAKEQGPEAWDRLMATKGKQVPFEQADSAIGPGVGMGNAFKMYQDIADRKAAEKLQLQKQGHERNIEGRKDKRAYKPTSLQSNVPFIAKEMGITRKQAAEILTRSEAMPEEEVINQVILTLAKYDPDMSREELEEKAQIFIQARRKAQAENPDDPLGLK